MFSSATSANKVTNSLLAIWYEQEKCSSGDFNYIKVTRFAKKSVSFIDMTSAAADAQAAALLSKFTRRYGNGQIVTTGDSPSISNIKVTECKSDISTSRNSNGSYAVTININETDIKLFEGTAFLTDPATEFSIENMRDYLED